MSSARSATAAPWWRRRSGCSRQITQANPRAKVIMFTAMNDPLLRQRSFEMGASAFVCKVATDGDLLSAVLCLCDEGP